MRVCVTGRAIGELFRFVFGGFAWRKKMREWYRVLELEKTDEARCYLRGARE